MFCVNCACELPAVAKFCVRCGSIVEPSTSSTLTRVAAPPMGKPVEAASAWCSKCGGQNPSDYSFCTSCGASLRAIGSPLFVSNTVTAFSANVPPVENKQRASEVQRAPLIQPAQSAPLRDNVLDLGLASSQPSAIDNTLVVPRNAVLPGRCVKCGNIPADPWLRKTFSWHHPVYIFFSFSTRLFT